MSTEGLCIGNQKKPKKKKKKKKKKKNWKQISTIGFQFVLDCDIQIEVVFQ